MSHNPSFRDLRRFGTSWLIVLGGLAAATWTGCATGAPGRAPAKATTNRPAAPQPLTFDTFYGPKPPNFSGQHVGGLKWRPDGQHYLEWRNDILQEIDARTDEARPVYDYAQLEAALKANADFDEAAAARLARHPERLTEDYSAALLIRNDRLYVYRFADKSLTKLADDSKERREVTLSPDGRHLAWLRDNNLYAASVETGATHQLTRDGSETTLNGLLDWVYQEEVYGRGHWRAYWWSKDGGHLAYLQLDTKDVPVYPLVNYLETHPAIESLRWPKAGDPNAKIRLGVIRPDGDETVWVDLSKYDATDILIVTVAWAPDGRIVYQVQDREQRWVDLNDADPATGASRTLLHESVENGWIDREESAPHWLDDGSFLWLSVVDGYRHLYHYRRDGHLIARVTQGPWEIRALYGIDPNARTVYFSANADSPVETHAYRVPLAGGQPVRLTTPGFTHDVEIAPATGNMLDTFSNVATPTKVYLRAAGGDVLRVLSENDVASLKDYRWKPPQVLRVPTDRGYGLNGLLWRPANWSAKKKYPVYCPVYGGPHASSVRNSWHGRDSMYNQWLADQGYLVWECDPYSASGEGAVSAWHAYQRLGAAELEDLETGIQYLIDHYGADPARVSIFGHSYGGFMVAYALTHGSKFTAGIAVAGVMDWRNYDSIYTERFMRTPQNDPNGYKIASVVAAAKDLHGKLLIVHGAVDDNVHFQNSLQLIEALENARRPFELMVYPSADHGAWGYYAHGPRLGLDFLRRCFGVPAAESFAVTAANDVDRPRRQRPRPGRPPASQPVASQPVAGQPRATHSAAGEVVAVPFVRGPADGDSFVRE